MNTPFVLTRCAGRSVSRGADASFEQLEARALFTAVSWDGGAGDDLWSSPTNWSNDVVPGAADDVTIDVAANPTIRFTSAAGARSINSLLTRENLTFEGGLLQIGTTASVDGAVAATLQGGTLSGGSWSYSSGGSLAFSSSGGTLNNVATNTDILLNTASASITLQGTTSFLSLHLSAGSAAASFAPGYTIGAPIVADGAASGTRLLNLALGGTGTVIVGPTGSITLASGAGGGLTIANASSATLQNDGLISAEAAGRTLLIQTDAFTNDAGATARATAGSLTINSPFYINAGTFRVTTGATFDMGGSFFAGGAAGSFVHVGNGQFNINGIFNNIGNTFTFNAISGSFYLNGGTIQGGALVTSDNTALLLTTQNGLVKDIDIYGEIRTSHADAYCTISGTATFAALRLSDGFSKVTLATTIVNTGLISAEGSSVGDRTILGTSFANLGTIRSDPSVMGIFYIQPSITNSGLIAADNATYKVSMSGSLTNTAAGVVRALGGDLILNYNATASTNAGTLQVGNGHTLTLDTVINATAGFGTLLNDGTAVTRIDEVLTNTGNTINLDNTTGSLTVSGVVNGGSIVCSGNAAIISAGVNGKINNVVVTGDILLKSTGTWFTIGTGTTYTAARLSAANVRIFLPEGSNGLVIDEGPATGTRYVNVGTLGTGSVVRVAPGAGGPLVFTSQADAATLTNNGLLSVETATQVMYVGMKGYPQQAYTFTNSATGVMQSIAGLMQISADNYTNAGTLKAIGGTVAFGGQFNTAGGIGTLITTGAGSFVVNGKVNNVGGSIALDATTGPWTLFGGTINGGFMTLTGVKLLTTSTAGTLANLAIAGEIALSTVGAALILSGDVSFSAARYMVGLSSISLANGCTFNGLISTEGNDASNRFLYVNGTATIGPSGIVRRGAGTGGALLVQQTATATLINNGVVQALGSNVTIQTALFTNNGYVDAAGGVIQFNTGITNIAGGALVGGQWNASAGGRLGGYESANLTTLAANVTFDHPLVTWGALNKLETVTAGFTLTLVGGSDMTVTPASGTFTNHGTLILGPGSVLQVNGNLVLAADGALAVLMRGGASAADYGMLSAGGTGQLDGALLLQPVNGYVPVRNDVQDFLVTVGACAGTFAVANYPAPGNPDWKTVLVYTGNGARLLTTSLIDFNNDGTIDLNDYFDFFNGWDISDNSVDLNHDGTVDLNDFFQFFNLFDQG